MQLEIVKTLVVSTLHITKEDSEVLSESHSNEIVAHSYEEGWWVWTGEANEHFALLSVFANNVIAVARENDCQWVRFDADGPEIEGLEKFEW